MRLILFLILFGQPALAECPPPPNHATTLDELHAELMVAADPGIARTITDQLWPLWLDAPDELAQELLDDGMERRNFHDLLGSVDVLGRLTAYCPDWAEGWNQRAFSLFLARDYPAALADLDRALALNPRHIGALTGRAMTLLNMGRETEAVADLRTALALNPWLAERALLPGEDI